MLIEILEKYLEIFPEERDALKLLSEQIEAGQQLNDRKNFRGHIAGDGMVISPDRKKLLMVHHRAFDLWLQPGGHWDPEDPNPMAAARREVAEETGLQNFSLIEWLKGYPLVPIDIDTHSILARDDKNEAAHYHYSFAYAFQATALGLVHEEAEVLGARWFAMSEAETMDRWHFPRVIPKLKKFHLI